jgi:hypothetical protein
VGCSGEAVAGVGGVGGRLVRVVDGRHSAAGEWRRWLRLESEVIDGEGVARLDVLGQQRSTMSSLRR